MCDVRHVRCATCSCDVRRATCDVRRTTDYELRTTDYGPRTETNPMRKRSLWILMLVAIAALVATVAAGSGGSSVFTDWIARMHGVPGH